MLTDHSGSGLPALAASGPVAQTDTVVPPLPVLSLFSAYQPKISIITIPPWVGGHICAEIHQLANAHPAHQLPFWKLAYKIHNNQEKAKCYPLINLKQYFPFWDSFNVM